jgi:hypothetical protein
MSRPRFGTLTDGKSCTDEGRTAGALMPRLPNKTNREVSASPSDKIAADIAELFASRPPRVDELRGRNAESNLAKPGRRDSAPGSFRGVATCSFTRPQFPSSNARR